MSEQSAHGPSGDDIGMSTQAHDNHVAFVERHQTRLESEHSGKMALMRNGEVVEILDDKDVAYELGLQRYGAGNFSLERIGVSPHSLGVLAYAFE